MASNWNCPASLPVPTDSILPVTTSRNRTFAPLIGVLSASHAVPTTVLDRTPDTTPTVRAPLTTGRSAPAAAVPFDPLVRSVRSVAPSVDARTVRPRPAATIKFTPRILVIASSSPSRRSSHKLYKPPHKRFRSEEGLADAGETESV